MLRQNLRRYGGTHMRSKIAPLLPSKVCAAAAAGRPAETCSGVNPGKAGSPRRTAAARPIDVAKPSGMLCGRSSAEGGNRQRRSIRLDLRKAKARRRNSISREPSGTSLSYVELVSSSEDSTAREERKAHQHVTFDSGVGLRSDSSLLRRCTNPMSAGASSSPST